MNSTMHWAKQSRIDRMKFARACSDPERRAEWVAIARKYHRIYLRDKRENAKHLAWMGEKEAQNFAAMLRRDTSGQVVAQLFGEFMDFIGDRPASRELIATDLVLDVVGVLG